MRGPLSCLNEARYGIVWGSMGAARACFQSALEYATTRVQFDRPIGGFQLTQQKLADMLVELSKGTLLALHLGRMKDEGRLAPEQVSLGKVIRHANNLESVLTYEGTSEVHSLILGQAVTGLAAFT
jgi:glutaryl-CoA dehydrogenase